MAEDNIKSVIEALLFASEKPLMLEQIKDVLGGIGSTEIREILSQMQQEFEQANRGVRIIEVAGGFRMVTAPAHSPFLKKFFKEKKVERLSKPALETLAIIAYKQPVTKLEIESFRNVNVDGVINSLLDKSLIRVAGRKKAPGSPFVFATTRQFLEHFGLKSLEELPKMEDFSSLANKEVVDGPKETA
jgi:segregation and condensation protein B